MISTPKLAPDSRNVSGFPSLKCGFMGLCPSRLNTGGTYIYPYYFHRGKVLTSRPTLVRRLLLLPWLVYREYPPSAGRSPFTQQSIYSSMCGCQYHACGCDVTGRGHVGSQPNRRMRIWGDTPVKGPHVFAPSPFTPCPHALEGCGNHSNACARQAHR